MVLVVSQLVDIEISNRIVRTEKKLNTVLFGISNGKELNESDIRANYDFIHSQI